MKCAGADAPNCLTAPQLDVVKQVYAGAKLPNGEVYAYGFPFGHEGGATGWQAWINGAVDPVKQPTARSTSTASACQAAIVSRRSNFKFLAVDDDDPKFSWRTFNLDRDLPRMKRP